MLKEAEKLAAYIKKFSISAGTSSRASGIRLSTSLQPAGSSAVAHHLRSGLKRPSSVRGIKWGIGKRLKGA